MSKNDTALVRAVSLRKAYDTPAGPLEILKGVEFCLEPAQMSFVVGKSGCGKSTLVHLLGGLDEPTAGQVFFSGTDLTRLSEKELAQIRNERMGYVFQFYHLLPELTVHENILLPMMISDSMDSKWAKEIMKKIKIWSRKDHFPSELSGGEKQRVAIARALVRKPDVVFCDEPTGNLDEETSQSIQELLTSINRWEGQAFLIVTHDEAWAYRNSRVFRLTEGVLVPDHHKDIPIQKISS